MSTRKGKVVWLEDVIAKCEEKAYAIVSEKNPALEKKREVAEKVGVGAVIFGALCNNKIKDIVFSYDKALNFDGETSVYVQYTCARAASVLSKAGAEIACGVMEPCDVEYELIKALAQFPDVVRSAAKNYEPSIIARYCVDTAQKFNKFYIECKILQAEKELRAYRLSLTQATLRVLTNALGLLGIGVPEKM